MIDKFHCWTISSDSAEERETALYSLRFKAKEKAEHDMEYSFRQVLDKIRIEYIPVVTDVGRWNLWKSIAAAAVTTVLPVIAALQMSYNHFDRDNTAMVEYYANNGTREAISPPDGTTVHLSSGSHMFYLENLEDKTQTIYLIGEAESKIARNPKEPFIMRSPDMAATALGTESSVKVHPEEDVITASLIEGKVRADCNDTISYVSTPGYQIVYNRYTDDCRTLVADMKDATAWIRGELVFDKVVLARIARTLERYYGITFRISTKKSNQDRYSFIFRKGATLEEALEAMRVIIGQFNYRLEGSIRYIIWWKKTINIFLLNLKSNMLMQKDIRKRFHPLRI